MALTRAEIQARYRHRQKLLTGGYEKELLRVHEENERLKIRVERLCEENETLRGRVERLESNLRP